MQLTEHIYLVASGDTSFSLTGALDCNVYLIDTGAGLILIDAGALDEPEKMDVLIAAHGFSLSQIKMIILTHYHADHAGGAARISSLSGCAVYASAREADAISRGDQVAIGLAAALRAGYVYPAGYGFAACPGVKPLHKGDIINLGTVNLQVWTVPGHSLEDIVLSGAIDGKNCLFTGDALFPGGKILLQNLPDVSIHPYAEAVKELAGLPVDAFFPGHREPSLNRGKRHVQAAVRYFDSLLIPPQFL